MGLEPLGASLREHVVSLPFLVFIRVISPLNTTKSKYSVIRTYHKLHRTAGHDHVVNLSVGFLSAQRLIVPNLAKLIEQVLQMRN